MRIKAANHVSVKPGGMQLQLLMVVLGLSLLASACGFGGEAGATEVISDMPASNQPWEEQGEIWFAFDAEQPPLELITHGFEVWLAQFAQENAPDDVALLDSRIDTTEAISDPFFAGEYDFVFFVEYSIRPRSSPSRWLAGDGRQGIGGWVVDKIHYVGIMIIGEEVRVQLLGPCPMC